MKSQIIRASTQGVTAPDEINVSHGPYCQCARLGWRAPEHYMNKTQCLFWVDGLPHVVSDVDPMLCRGRFMIKV